MKQATTPFAGPTIYLANSVPDDFFEFADAPLDRHAPGIADAHAHLLVHSVEGEPIARCSVWIHNSPMLQGERAGFIGHFAARTLPGDDPARVDRPAIDALLNAACDLLARAGCVWAVGPVDGSTFRRYRFVIDRFGLEGSAIGRSDEHPAQPLPPFFLEPDNPDSWPQHFVAAGFAPLADYFSAVGDLAAEDESLVRLARRAQAQGARLRPLEPARFEDELSRVYEVICAAFARNFLYTPLSSDEFMAQYLPMRAYLHPQLVWLAEKGDRTVGFIFCVPDLAQARRGESVDTVIVKTVGILPDAGILGLGHWLTAHAQQAAFDLGYRRVIHALIHVDNISAKISRRYALPMRQYRLYARRLAGLEGEAR